MPDPKRPILYKGEHYSSSSDRRQTVRPSEPNVSYEEARDFILKDLSNIVTRLEEIPDEYRLPNETIVSFRVQSEYADKSFYPNSLFYPGIQSSTLQEIGSKLHQVRNPETDKLEYEKFYYIRTTQQGLSDFYKKLNRKQSDLADNFQRDIRKMAGLDIPSPVQKIKVNPEWEAGRLEVTLHPFLLDRSLSLSHFRKLVAENGINPDLLKIKQYTNGGLTFVSMPGNRGILEVLGQYNPLRSAHPMEFRSLIAPHRSATVPGAPNTSPFSGKPSVVIGVIDGGYQSGNASVDNYVDAIDCVNGIADREFTEHGFMVTSAVVHGGINKIKNSDTLPEPDVAVRCFRVLSVNSSDPDLYDVIDEIEKIVPANADIQVYNISIGPNSGIIDTEIDRFTYALDLLSKKHNVLFNVAVGNNGLMDGYNRIQSPSDMVNGLGVGAYSLSYGSAQRSDYSCIGPGREGSKLKPDIVAFGGCERMPIQLLGVTPGTRIYTKGTSFAAPLSSRMSGRLIGNSAGVLNALSTKALLIHDASKNNDRAYSTHTGHGILCDDMDALMDCGPNGYTLVYEGELEPGRFRTFEIPWIADAFTGKVEFNYTVAVQTSVDPASPEDYATSSVELLFYPNAYKYRFESPDGKKTKRVDIIQNQQQALSLEMEGWKQSNFPVAESVEHSGGAAGGLKANLKWDTVDVRSLTKLTSSIKDPSFQIHAISRGSRASGEKVRFAVIFSIEALSSTDDIYNKIINKYDALLPISLNVNNQVRIRI